MLTTIKLYGHLGQQFGKEFTFDIDTVAESIRALDANIQGFKQYLTAHSEPGYRVVVDGRPVMDEAELGLCVSRPGTIKIVPVVRGASGGKSIGKIILGAVLVIAAVVINIVPVIGQALSPYIGAEGLAMMAATGVSLIAGGIAELVTAVPSSVKDNAKQAANVGFANNLDTIVQGLRMPIGYGRMLCEGYPISVRVVVENNDAIALGAGK